MTERSLGTRLTMLLALAFCTAPLSADVGVVVYESKGVDARRTDTGHISLIATNLCAEGIDRLRECNAGEPKGVVITRYANLAAGYTKTVFAVPILDHFAATDRPELVPAISNGTTLEAMQMEYWRKHLRAYLPPLSQTDYEAMRDEAARFDFGRTVRQFLTLEFLSSVLGAHKKRFPTEPFAMIDPETKELIPNGRWREAIGAGHVRRSIVITSVASPEQERQLITYIQAPNLIPFNAISDNCSDFVRDGLIAVFPQAKERFRRRSLQVADAWITSPLAVASDYLSYLHHVSAPQDVSVVPMIAGTRRPTASVTSISRGALVPNTSQGKTAFALKVYFNTMNPLLMITTVAVDQMSRFADLQRLVHERGSASLSAIANRVSTQPKPETRELQALRREQARVFGTTGCWKAKQMEFKSLASEGVELGVFSKAESLAMLKRSQPFLLARIYEQAAAKHGNASLVTGIEDCSKLEALENAGCALNTSTQALSVGFSGLPAGFVPSREAIGEALGSGNRLQHLVALKIMASVINYDLSQEPAVRRISERFDPDWKLFLRVAQRNGMVVPAESPAWESVGSCSGREFDQGIADKDILGQERMLTRRLARQGRELVLGPSR